MDELVFHIRRLDDGGYTAAAQGHAIFTEAASLEELRRHALDAARCHFDHGMGPKTIRLKFARHTDTPA